MTKLLFFVFLFGLLHLGDAWSQSYENSFFVGQPRFTSFAIPVLGSPLKLNLVSTNNSAIFVLCGQRHFQPTADFKSWNAKTCQFYADTNSSTPTSNDNTPRISRRTRQTFASEQEIGRDLVPGSYWVGIFVQNMGANATFTFSGQDCSSGQFGLDCSIAVTRIIEWNQNDTLSFQNADDVKYLELKVDRTQTNIANLSFELQTQGSSHYDVNFRLFYGTLPLNMSNPLLWSTGMTVNNKTSVLTVGGGSDGDYIVVLSPTKTRAKRRVFEDDFPLMMTWSTQLTKCLTTKFGPNCQNATKINATALSQVFTYSSTPNTFDYFYFSDTASQVAFNMTVQSKSGSSNAPALYVRKGAAPTELLYDGVSANSSVNSINLGAHDGGKWFFGVLGTGSDYAIWINTQCPNGCSSNGNCVLSNGAYSCQCNDGYELFDCSQKKDSGFKTEYIVLIVIGSIIALAALVGLIVYLYNRGKHPGGGYERI